MKLAKELKLEDYVDFFNTKNADQLTVQHLVKIMSINGLSRGKMNKSQMVDLLRTVDLIPPGRSTVGKSLPRSSISADLSVDDVRQDVAAIGWQACPIVSVVTIGNETAASAGGEFAGVSTSSSFGRSKRKRRETVAGFSSTFMELEVSGRHSVGVTGDRKMIVRDH